jgi:SAM-dependent methyltransferase
MFPLTPQTTILDLGGGNGAHIHSILSGSSVQAAYVCVADIRCQTSAYGYSTRQIAERGPLPFLSGEFDIIFCNSVIEHRTGAKAEIWNPGFAARALTEQKTFAAEIRRVGKRYWVQTPARSFPIESHTKVLFIHWLPRQVFLLFLKLLRLFWFRHRPDFRLLTKRDMRELFPDARLIAERSCGMVKSWIAVR